MALDLRALQQRHRFPPDGCEWALTPQGISIDGAPPAGTPGEPLTVRRVWQEYGESIDRWCSSYQVPVELVIATICTESGGNAEALRIEPGYYSDEETPHRISVGLMQTLLSTAREALQRPDITRSWLLNPDHSIQAGTAYITHQVEETELDPPKVACAYNAGGLYYQAGTRNRWKMRQFPIGGSDHADRFVAWFNDCFTMLEADGGAPTNSFYRMLRPQRQEKGGGMPFPLIPLLVAAPAIVSAVAKLFHGEDAAKIDAAARAVQQVAGQVAGNTLPPEQLIALETATEATRIELARIELEQLRLMVTDAQGARDLIVEEGKSEDPYVRRARPTGLYIGYGCLGCNYVILPLLQLILNRPIVPFELPELFWMAYLGGYLGYAVLRSSEKGVLSLPWGLGKKR